MIDPNASAFPCQGNSQYHGLSIREYFIAAALKGLCANPAYADYALAASAVELADQTLALLNERKERKEAK